MGLPVAHGQTPPFITMVARFNSSPDLVRFVTHLHLRLSVCTKVASPRRRHDDDCLAKHKFRVDRTITLSYYDRVNLASDDRSVHTVADSQRLFRETSLT